jgi:hypothetical protein
MAPRKQQVERIALQLYDILNPDQRCEILISKARCIKMADDCLTYLELLNAAWIASFRR